MKAPTNQCSQVPVKPAEEEPRYDAAGLLVRGCMRGGECEWISSDAWSDVFCGRCFVSYPREASK